MLIVVYVWPIHLRIHSLSTFLPCVHPNKYMIGSTDPDAHSCISVNYCNIHLYFQALNLLILLMLLYKALFWPTTHRSASVTCQSFLILIIWQWLIIYIFLMPLFNLGSGISHTSQFYIASMGRNAHSCHSCKLRKTHFYFRSNDVL